MEKEFYEEFEDMEAGIDQKQALVEESKKVDEIEDFSEAVRFVNDLKKRWRKTGFGESLAEEKLREEFETNIEKVYEKQKELSQKVVEVKEALIKRRAMEQTKEAYVLADASKFGEISTVTFGAFADATILTNQVKQEYRGFSNIKEVEE